MSKYSSLLQATQQPSPISEEAKSEEAATAQEKPVQEIEASLESKVDQPTPAPAALAANTAPTGKVLNMEPPRGKKGHPDYNQVTIYLKKQTQNKAKIAMLQAQDERDFSELVEDLLTQWLSGRSV